MSYAVRLDGLGWRAVDSEQDCLEGERWMAKPPVLEAVPVSYVVSQRQARLALLAAGKLDDVQAAVAAAPEAVRIAWDYADVIDRTNPLIDSIGSSLGWSSSEIDELFRQASAL